MNSRRYDLLGRIVQREEVPGRSYQFGYDSQGRLSTVEGPDGQVIEERHYDSRTGELKTIRAPRNGSETHYTFDNQGRLSEVTDPEGYTVSYRYDTYNSLNQLSAYHPASSAANTPDYQYRRRNDGLLTEETDPLGRTRSYRYDAQGRLIADDKPARRQPELPL